MERIVEIVNPAPPRVDASRKPSEVQLAQVPERMPMEEPEKKRWHSLTLRLLNA